MKCIFGRNLNSNGVRRSLFFFDFDLLYQAETTKGIKSSPLAVQSGITRQDGLLTEAQIPATQQIDMSDLMSTLLFLHMSMIFSVLS